MSVSVARTTVLPSTEATSNRCPALVPSMISTYYATFAGVSSVSNESPPAAVLTSMPCDPTTASIAPESNSGRLNPIPRDAEHGGLGFGDVWNE